METFGIFNPRLIITDHFGKIKNEIDIKVETIIDENRQFNKKEIDVINEIRKKQINKIEEIEQNHLFGWPSNFDREQYQFEWADLINSTSLSDAQKLDKIRESIIKIDAMLIARPRLLTKTCLCVMPFYVNELNLEFLK